MKKIILFLFLAIAMATTAMAQFSFSNEKVYTLTTTRGWLIYNPDNEAFVASTASYTNFAVSEGNANCQWAIHKSKNGRYYLYNIGSVPAEKQNAIYDLQGRRVIEPQKGAIYIKNSKKFIAR